MPKKENDQDMEYTPEVQSISEFLAPEKKEIITENNLWVPVCTNSVVDSHSLA